MPHQYYLLLNGVGGFALFIYGMMLLADGLSQASGPWFRKIMATVSKRKLRGLSLGVAMGTAMQSSASTVMAVGFIHAGLLSLAGAVPLIAGANFGTSLAMQFIALDKEWIWPVLAMVGLPLRLIPGNARRQRSGQALLALALLFLGMRLMSQSVYPFRETLSSLLAFHHGSDVPSMLTTMGISLAFTALIQSSGATIGILFSLAASGVFTNMEQVIPLLVGAHIGTCITALLSSIGTGPDARRGAMAHLYFNLIGGAFAFALLPWLADLVETMGGSPTRQVANLHTLIMAVTCLVVVPASGLLATFLRFTLRFKKGQTETSFLTEDLIEQPALALDAVDRELARLTRIVRKGFALNRQLLASPGRHHHQFVKQTEEAVDLIRWAMRQYLMRVAVFTTDALQAKRMQWMDLILTYLERISDHNDNLADLTLDLDTQLTGDELAYARATCERLYQHVDPLLHITEQICSAAPENRLALAHQLLALRRDYQPVSKALQNEVITRIANGQTRPLTGFFLTEYTSEMDRIVRHTKKIAGLIEQSSAPAA